MRFRLFAAIFVFTALSCSACSLATESKIKDKAQKIITPDYSHWPMRYSTKKPMLHNGNRVELLHELYSPDYSGDPNKDRKAEYVYLIYNESQSAWLLVYDFEEVNVSLKSVTTHFQIFEYKNSKYIFVKDFKFEYREDDFLSTKQYEFQVLKFIQEWSDFLKEKYGLSV